RFMGQRNIIVVGVLNGITNRWGACHTCGVLHTLRVDIILGDLIRRGTSDGLARGESDFAVDHLDRFTLVVLEGELRKALKRVLQSDAVESDVAGVGDVKGVG